jgi:hypothetical protein
VDGSLPLDRADAPTVRPRRRRARRP